MGGGSGGRLRQGNIGCSFEFDGAGRSGDGISLRSSIAGGLEPGQPAPLRKVAPLPVRDAFSLPPEPGWRWAVHQRGTYSSLLVPFGDGKNRKAGLGRSFPGNVRYRLLSIPHFPSGQRRHSGGIFRWPDGRAKPAGRTVRREKAIKRYPAGGAIGESWARTETLAGH